MSNSETLIALAERVEAATGADREIDLSIHLALDPEGAVAVRIRSGRRGLTGEAGQRWELSYGALLYEQRDEQGNCWANGGIPVKTFTGSLDTAMTLVPAGWRVYSADFSIEGRFVWTLKGPFAPDDDDEAFLVFQWGTAPTPALALTAASLRALAQGQTDE